MILRRITSTTLSVALFFAFAEHKSAQADEIKVLTVRAMATVLTEIGSQFESTTGHRLKITVDLAPRLVRQIKAGETFDLLIVPPPLIDGLVKDGKINANTRTNLMRSGIGVEVRAGARRPDISSVEAFKRALLNAKSIAYLKEGASGVYLASLFERLGIASAIDSKTTRPETDIVSELVAKGEIELGMVVTTQILTTPGVELVGQLPPEVQHYVVWAAGVSTHSLTPDASTALIRFLKGPSAIQVITAQGMEMD